MRSSLTFCIAVLCLCQFTLNAEIRTWTSSDGRTTEAEFVKADTKTVTLKKGSRTFKLPLEKISAADKEYIKTKLAEVNQVSVSSLGDHAKYAKASWVKGEHKKLQFQIYAPDSYTKDNKLPLVIFLHGSGERGSDNEKQMDGRPEKFTSEKNLSKRPCIVIAPQCPSGQHWTNGDLVQAVLSLTKDITKNMPVDEDRIYLSGFSMGGYGTWALLADSPKTFAAAIPISGGANPSIANKIKNIPIWNFHGDADNAVAVNNSRTIIEALEKAKAKIKYTEYKGAGHSICRKVLSDEKVMEWLFEQKKN
ncbi:MAG: prolyl oligopeptidase family serine peptidase [Akkermansiaceae bacterium]